MRVAMLGDDLAYARSGDFLGAVSLPSAGLSMTSTGVSATPAAGDSLARLQEQIAPHVASAPTENSRAAIASLLPAFISSGLNGIASIVSAFTGNPLTTPQERASVESAAQVFTRSIPWIIGWVLGIVGLVILIGATRRGRR